jgi:hypothetical protein
METPSSSKMTSNNSVNNNNNNKPRNTITSSITYETNMSRKSVIQLPKNEIMFVPCINCGNLVHIDDIDDHSNVCVRVKEEIIVAEKSQYSYITIDYKLKKLHEHLIQLKNSEKNLNVNDDLSKEMHFILLLSQYILDGIGIAKISNKSLAELKKILINIDVKIFYNDFLDIII